MNVTPKKSLGQNFLQSTEIARAVVSAGDVREGDVVIEVGPGTGVLTRELLNTGARVVAIEKDRRLIASLETKFEKEIAEKKLIVKEGDILQGDVADLAGEQPFKVVANIPYYITGELLRVLFEGSVLPERIAVMVQKEVAERIYAHDGKESILSVSVKVFGQPRIERIVPRAAFSPVPNVDSAVISVSDISSPFEDRAQREKFFEFIKTGFRHKRKMLRSNLSEKFGDDSIHRAFQKCGITPNARAENISVSDWQCILKHVS